MIAKKYIVFDVGKTKILAAVVKMSKKKYEFLEMIEFKNPHNPQKIQKIVLDFCQSARAKYWTKKVAISAAHLVDPQKKIISQGKKCYGVEIFAFRFLEEEGFGVRIENDGRCFALGEYYFGRGRKANYLLALALGTEIGGGFVLNGNNFRGAHNSSLEVSHISASYLESGKEWASLCAGKGIENLYKEKTGRKISAKEIFQEARRSRAAQETLEKAAYILGRGTASLINILDPDIVVFGGSLSKQREFVAQAVKIAQKNIFNKKAPYKFALSRLGNKANLLGAATLYF